MEEEGAKSGFQEKRRRKGSIRRQKGAARARPRAIHNKLSQGALMRTQQNLPTLSSTQMSIN